MEIIRPGTKIDFMGRRNLFIGISATLVLLSLLLIIIKGFDMGVDFKGGSKIIVSFKSSAHPDRQKIREVINQFVATKIKTKGKIQVEVQDFDVGGGASSDTQKFQILTELSSLLTPLERLKLAKELEKHFGKGTIVDISESGGDKFYLTLPVDWPVSAAKKEIEKVFARTGHPEVEVYSDKEERIRMETAREKDILGSAKTPEAQEELARIEKEAKNRIAKLKDRRYTIQVQELRSQIAKVLKEHFKDGFVAVLSASSVSAKVGRELFMNGLVAMLYAIIGILLYVALRFDTRFAPGAVIALIHDATISMGFVSLLDIKFTLPIIAALLTLIGYSINDTIVVYDRIRENLNKGRYGKLLDVINVSVNETLSRTLLTSGTTLLTVLSIYLFGGGTIKDFALVLLIGVIVGTYSSIFIASPITWYLDKLLSKKKLARA